MGPLRLQAALALALGVAGHEETRPPFEHVCIHDRLRPRVPTLVPQRGGLSQSASRRALSEDSGLRILFEVEPLGADGQQCTRVGQVIDVGESGGPACTPQSQDDCRYTCQAKDVLSPAAAERLTGTVLPAVVDWFKAAFKLRDYIPRPDPLTVDTRRTCGFGGPVPIPERLGSPGVSGADVVILVTSRPVAPASSALAYAGACQEDQGTPRTDSPAGTPYTPRRPILGHINVVPSVVTEPSAASWENPKPVDRVLKLVIHEVMHVLGFSLSRIEQWPCPADPTFNRHRRGSLALRACSSSPDGPASEEDAAPVANFDRTLNGVTYTEVGVRTPAVLARARSHYDCVCGGDGDGLTAGCIQYMPLENSGGDGTAASHWEKRTMGNEIMSGTLSSDLAPISNITLALFEDSGWFEPNYDVAGPECYVRAQWCTARLRSAGEDGGYVLPIKRADAPVFPQRVPLLWGAGRGCSFVTGSCAGDAWDVEGYFCDASAPATGGCTVGRVSVGYCSYSTYSSSLPPQFQYFAGMPNVGGNAAEDFCPIWSSYSNYQCRYYDDASEAFANGKATYRGESRCENCRCSLSSLYNSARQEVQPAYGCYEERCLSGTRLQMRVGETWYDCNSQPQPGIIRVTGWTGYLTCPPASIACSEAADLGWPLIESISPPAGPAAGGTAFTITGSSLGANDTTLPTVSVCGVAATNVHTSNASGIQILLATTSPFLNAETGAERTGTTACSVRVSRSNGRYGETSLAFSYVGPPGPPPSQPPIDLENGWTADAILSMGLRIWPYVLTVIIGLLTLHWAYQMGTQFMLMRRMRYAAKGRLVRGRHVLANANIEVPSCNTSTGAGASMVS